jgi:hypothetical protein
MTYEMIKKSIDAALCKATIRSALDAQSTVYKVLLHMDPGANTWNRAAIELAEENTKIPSRRLKIVCYPVVAAKVVPEGTRMTTNEWNSLALEARKRHREKEEEETFSNNAIQPTR